MPSEKELYSLFSQGRKVLTDSRKICEGSIFFALKGENFDGNKYAAQALEAGADFAVIDDGELFDSCAEFKERLVLVDEVLNSLQKLANEHRKSLKTKIIAITGSNGKTTTKELLCAVLRAKYRVAATEGNLNNHIGVPLTLLSFTPDDEIGIVEMGASARGEIAGLCAIAEPDFGYISNIGRAHLEGFGGAEGIEKAKGELYDFLATNNGLAFVPSENEKLQRMAQARQSLRKEEFSYSLADGIEHQLEGEYNKFNIAAALAIGAYFSVSKDNMRSAIAAYKPQNKRSQIVKTERNTLIVDCYNANPSSMEAAIESMEKSDFSPLTKVLILGEMRELGEWSNAEHTLIAFKATQSAAQKIFFVGRGFEKVLNEILATEAKQEAAVSAVSAQEIKYFATRQDLEQMLSREPLSSCAILIKASRGVGLENIIELL